MTLLNLSVLSGKLKKSAEEGRDKETGLLLRENKEEARKEKETNRLSERDFLDYEFTIPSAKN